MLKKISGVFLFMFCVSFAVSAQSDIILPKRELRGVWIATVRNIDWPSKGNTDPALQQMEFLKILDSHQKTGINSIYLQVRPSADAFYGKGRELWSQFLTGKQGLVPDPYWDPLDFAITEAHKRGMELHAWLNPYRATNDLIDTNTSVNHIKRKHPDWFFDYGKQSYFNPGLPEVRNYITQIVMDVVRNYDVDGIHFDDYFYPYPEKKSLPDSLTFAKYGQEFTSIHDWRRNNVDILIRDLSDSIHAARKYVKFGVSPYAIWRNRADVPEGSETSGNITLFHSLYSDARKWTKEGWLDYVAPQLYFPFNYKVAAFEKLMDWWAGNGYGKHVYIGEAPFLAERTTFGWKDKNQLPDQVRYQRKNPNVHGSIYFSSRSVTDNLGGFRDSLRNDLYAHQSLVPAMVWIDSIPPARPSGLKVKKKNGQSLLSWNSPLAASDGELAYGYVIYRFNKGSEINFNNPENILKINFNADRSFTDATAEHRRKYTYAVTAIDRLKNESAATKKVKIRVR
ncbi:family 10 glycosylhydrolase [Daejeonella sp. H1SJ63]|uniref:glycoside hydrolase family 10 protein n=1 Tax=Daejeonella sp. H1SJ63 TaxID=3034145 RepID=UPI0023EAAD45|nr:family 10 glycosylhydrolase [Daejeonella sp. H1SJ63]